MLISLLFLLFFVVFCGFMANRLYIGLSRGELNVKGQVYSRTSTPILYWLTMSFASIGLLFGMLLVAAGVFSLAS